MGIDTCTTATLSGCRSDFVGKIKPISNVTLRGVGGTLPVVGRGTFIFNFLDDHGKEQQLKVEDAYYVPRLKLRLFSPQQWSLQGPQYCDGTYVRGETTRGNITKLFFKGGTKTVKHDQKTGLPILHSSPNCKEFGTYMTTLGLTTLEARIHPTASTLAEDMINKKYLKRFGPEDDAFKFEKMSSDYNTTLANIPGESKTN